MSTILPPRGAPDEDCEAPAIAAPEPTTTTWRAILETARPTRRPPRKGEDVMTDDARSRDDDSSATPIEVPHPHVRRSRPDMTEMNGSASHGDDHGVRLSRELPDLPPLPLHPTPTDIAVRYGSFAGFMAKQWPILIDTLIGLHMTVVRIERRERTSWAWPLLVGLLFASSLGLAIAVIVLLHRR